MQRYTDTVLDRNGNVVQGASVSVTAYPSGAAASIYSSNVVGTPLTSLSTDSNGSFYFYAANGRYTVTVTYGSVSVTRTDVVLFDPTDASQFAVNPMTTAGDMIYGGSPVSGIAPPTRLAVGAATQVLGSSGSSPSWITSAATGVSPDTLPSTPNAADDEFEYGAGLDTTGARRSGATAWVWRNQGSATATVNRGSLVLACNNNGSVHSLHTVEQALPVGNWKYRAKIAGDSVDSNLVFLLGLSVIHSSGKLLFFSFTRDGVGTTLGYEMARYTNSTTFSVGVYSNIGNSLNTDTLFRFGSLMNSAKYMEVEYDGTNVYFRLSASGVDNTFETLATEATATFLGGAASTIGLTVDPYSATTARLVCDWFRRIA